MVETDKIIEEALAHKSGYHRFLSGLITPSLDEIGQCGC